MRKGASFMSHIHKSIALVLALVISLVGLPAVFAREMAPSTAVGGRASQQGMVTAQGEFEVVMRDLEFQPEEITVAPGTTVTWTNEDGFAHTVTAGTRGNPMGMFDENVPGGGTFSFAFEEAGIYDYFCSIHPGMSGAVIVEQEQEEQQAMMPSVTVTDQAIENGMVTVPQVVSDGPGWIVIHADKDGAPGPVIGRAAVSDGENADVMVEIDTEMVTEMLYAMLHTDTGEMGTYEFPDADPPVKVEGSVVVKPLSVTGGMAAEEMVTPSVTVNDQEIEDGMVTVQQVVSDGPGWIVIHADENGAPGLVIGHAAVSHGENADVTVDVDTGEATVTLYAMLHTDTGEVGTYKFPDADPPVKLDGNVVVKPFDTMVMLPETGAASIPWTESLLLMGGIVVLAAGIVVTRLRAMRSVRVENERVDRRR
jgi:plastocyanin